MRLYASGENGSRYCVTNNLELATKELNRLGFTKVISTLDPMSDDINEIMYFDDEGEIVPLSKLLEKNNYK